MLELDTPLVLVLALAASLVVAGQIFVLVRCYRRVGPNQALVIYGSNRAASVRVVIGGGALVVPFLQKAAVLSLEPLSLDLRSVRTRTSDGAACELDAVAQLKIEATQEAVRAAAGRFLDGGQEGIRAAAQPLLEGHLRAAMARLDSKDAGRWFVELGDLVREGAAEDLRRWGLELVGLYVREGRGVG